jgi:hypothetical protein
LQIISIPAVAGATVVAVVVVAVLAVVVLGATVLVVVVVDGDGAEEGGSPVVTTAPDCLPHAAAPRPAATKARKRRLESTVINSS